MKNTNYQTGWTTIAWVEVKSNSTYGFIDEFKCEKSGKKLEEESLFITRTNFKHRGNETDELKCYNRAHSPKKYEKVWMDWDELKKEKKEEINQILKEYNIKQPCG